jgi:hypothetical protein
MKEQNLLILFFSSFTFPQWGLFIHARRLFMRQNALTTTTHSGNIPCHHGLARHSEFPAALGSAELRGADQPHLMSPLRPTEWAPGGQKLSATRRRLTPPMAKPAKTTKRTINDYSPEQTAQADLAPRPCWLKPGRSSR